MIKRGYVICLIAAVPAYAGISTVYNLRVSETTKHGALRQRTGRPERHGMLASGTMLGTWRQSRAGIKVNCGSGLLSITYSPETFYVGVDTAVGKVTACTDGVCVCRTQFDDILFSAGYSPGKLEKVRVTLSGLFGIPTHRDVGLTIAQIGYAHYGLGVQLDGLILLSDRHGLDLRCAGRVVHFFPRATSVTVLEKEIDVIYNLGNIADIFIDFHVNKKHHAMDVGYDASFLFRASLSVPNIIDTASLNGIRNSFFTAYSYRFVGTRADHGVGAGLSYSFDSRPKDIGYEWIVTAWLSYGIRF